MTMIIITMIITMTYQNEVFIPRANSAILVSLTLTTSSTFSLSYFKMLFEEITVKT